MGVHVGFSLKAHLYSQRVSPSSLCGLLENLDGHIPIVLHVYPQPKSDWHRSPFLIHFSCREQNEHLPFASGTYLAVKGFEINFPRLLAFY